MQSSSTDVYPSTQTFTFAKATFTSPYVGAADGELYSSQQNAAGTGYEILQPLARPEQTLVKKYDTSKYTGGVHTPAARSRSSTSATSS